MGTVEYGQWSSDAKSAPATHLGQVALQEQSRVGVGCTGIRDRWARTTGELTTPGLMKMRQLPFARTACTSGT
jgi:hypothetical protein